MTSELIDVVVTKREDQGEAVAVFELARKEGGALPAFTAGAHIDVHVNDEIVRQYSLSNAPGDVEAYRLGVLKDPNSRGGSEAIHAEFVEGKEIQISEPRNHFPLDLDAEHSILVGGGIGITPMLTMAYELKKQGKSFELHYCCRTESSAAFLAELNEQFAEQIVLHFDDQGEEQKFDPATVIAPYQSGRHVYVCGPSGFMDWIISSAESFDYPKDTVHFEYFNAEVDTGGAAFEVYAEESDVTVQVAEGQTIAEALKEAGVKVDVSCEQGVCGTCLCDVIEGAPDHKDHFLTDEEKEDNDQIVLCCSRAKTDKLVLDI